MKDNFENYALNMQLHEYDQFFGQNLYSSIIRQTKPEPLMVKSVSILMPNITTFHLTELYSQ
ncbi:MAG: hypothetical protein IPM47_12550 [Sphingobacteriales bacterium]|nr:MAG: hypothetical protein IPM47_12550 [Sphingobacteriales bacterium]